MSNEKMSEGRIAALRAILVDVVPGPWEANEEDGEIDGVIFVSESSEEAHGVHIGAIATVDDFPCIDPDDEDDDPRGGYEAADRQCAANARFVALARMALPDALDDLDAAREEIRKLRLRLDLAEEAAASWKRRAESHGCNVADGDPDCG